MTKITEEELQKRLAVLRSKERIDGPDDPIYSSGLTVFSVPRSVPSTKTSTSGTAGTSSPHSSAPSGNMSDPKKALSIQNRVDQSLDEGAKERGHVR